MWLRFVQPYVERILLFAWFHLDIVDMHRHSHTKVPLKPGPPKGHYQREVIAPAELFCAHYAPMVRK